MTVEKSFESLKNLDIGKYSEKIINTMAEGLILIAPDGKILMVNKSFETMFGYQADEIVGKLCTALHCDMCEMGAKDPSMKWCSLFFHGQDVKKRCNIKKKDGSYLSVLKNASLLKNDTGEDIGAVEILTDISEIDRLDQTIHTLSRQLKDDPPFQGIIGKSQVIQKMFELVKKAAWSDAPVIIFGDSGTGKELVAQAIHNLGRRKDGPFVQLNCAALNESLLESELFGHVKGAFTGAYRHRIGRFETANEGDIFLDEIGDVPLSTQVKLLRVLEQKQIERVGDHQSIPVDARLITATNKNLQTLIQNGEFREDFFFRINVIPIQVPTLRERLDDVPLLVEYFISRLRKRTGKKIIGLTPETMKTLLSYSWPGNIRELKSVLEYAFAVADKGLITVDQLPPSVVGEKVPPVARQQTSLKDEPAEKQELIEALTHAQGNQSEAARLLDISRVTVWNRMKKFNIDLKKTLQ
ncbi:MAG: sigma 54-interacting transcriptional regulator [SAR324 cluster bacterium]|nr:sigma 54-interacting transcriptional regulator [SAR324 cluster bacterium]